MHHLRVVLKLAIATVNTYLSGVRFNLVTRGAWDTIKALDNDIVSQARKGIKHIEVLGEVSHAKLPVNSAFLGQIWDSVWLEPIFAEDINDYMVALAASFQFHFVWRTSNVSDADHGLKCRDVFVRDTDPNGEQRLVPFPWTDVNWEGPVHFELCQMSNKTTKHHEVMASLTTEKGRDDVLISRIRKWLDLAKWESSEDPFFCFRHTSYSNGHIYLKHLRPKDIASAVKEAAISFGLDPKLYSTHSLRKGGATICLINGVPREEVKRIAGWSAPSDTIDLYVQLTTNTAGAMAAQHTEDIPLLTMKTLEQVRENRGAIVTVRHRGSGKDTLRGPGKLNEPGQTTLAQAWGRVGPRGGPELSVSMNNTSN